MAFHDVSIYRGTRLATTSTRLEVAAKSPFLQQVLASIRMCDGCKEPTTLIFPAEDESQNTLQEMFKSQSFPVIYDTNDIIINDIRSTREIESFESAGGGDQAGAAELITQSPYRYSNTIEDEADFHFSGFPVFQRVEGRGEGFKVKRRKRHNQSISNQESPQECQICLKQFKTKKYLESHLALCHYKKELKPFLDEDLLQCNICHSQHSNIYNLRVHVASAHKKLEEVMQQTTKYSKLAGIEQSPDLSSDGDLEIDLGYEMDFLLSDSECL